MLSILYAATHACHVVGTWELLFCSGKRSSASAKDLAMNQSECCETSLRSQLTLGRNMGSSNMTELFLNLEMRQSLPWMAFGT